MKLPVHLHENPEILHYGTESERAYYLPYWEKAGDRVLVLNGDDWRFRRFDSVSDVPDSFADGEMEGFDTIPVPSCINMLGYERHQYANVRGPIPFDPPFVPLQNPCGAYVKEFSLNKRSESTYYLNFDGVDSCFYLWINSAFAGYSQVSHATSEFDVTRFVRNGTNRVSVLVFKWCDGTYFEDQDKLRMSGIFRDVYLLERPTKHIWDYTVKTVLSQDLATVTVRAEWKGAGGTIRYSLLDPMDSLLLRGQTDVPLFSCKIASPLMWSAEKPWLYTLVMETNGEKIRQKIGVRTAEIQNGIFLMNGKPVILKGVNRHDSDAESGYCITPQQLEADLAEMKRHNINAIRTSHYPSAPWAYELYSTYGFYVMSEADLETHNTEKLYGGGRRGYNYRDQLFESNTFGLLCSDPKYEKAVLDRVRRCVIREKNQTCVIIWSLGNESGYGVNMEKAARWIKEQDPSYLVHYESSIYQMPGHVNDLSKIDFYSRMYMPVEDAEFYCRSAPKKPLILCEFSHAMGNSCGDLEDYYRVFHEYPESAGGFVWEWCDHSVLSGRDANGKKRYLYGGDFGEFPNEKNFCMDGLLYPDRHPHTSLKELKNVIRPIRAAIAGDEVMLFSKMDFTNGEDLYEIEWERYENHVMVQKGTISEYALPPSGCCKIRLPVTPQEETTEYLILRYVLKSEQKLIPKGTCMGFDQLIIKREQNRPSLAKTRQSKWKYRETDHHVVIWNDMCRYCFDKRKGTPESIVVDQVNYLCRSMEYNIWRAPLDNDRKVVSEWKNAGYDRMAVRVYETKIVQDDSQEKIKVVFDLSIGAVFLQNILRLRAEYCVEPDGGLHVMVRGEKDPVFPFLPRFGLRLFLPQAYEKICYEGYGPHESYVDKHQASYFGRFEATIDGLHEDYICPQENGSHWGCDKLEISDDMSKIEVYGQAFSFNASHYMQEELERALHNFELRESGYTILCLDAQMSGIGSGSCGPELMTPYQVSGRPICLEMLLRFIRTETTDNEEKESICRQ